MEYSTFPAGHDGPQYNLETVPSCVRRVWRGGEIGYHGWICGSDACRVEFPDFLGVVAFGCDKDHGIVGHRERSCQWLSI